MSEIPKGVQPFHEAILLDPSDGRFEGEHALSIQVATDLRDLDRLQDHFDHSYGPTMDDDEARRLRRIVVDTYNEHFADTQDEDDYDGASGSRPLEKETNAISDHLRKVWWQEYYVPKTHDATREDFQGWLDGYLQKFGAAALAKTVLSDQTFHNEYRPFSAPIFEGRVPHDLRTSESDVLLIPGCGSRSITIIEAPGTTVNRALPKVFDHHTIYTNRIAPENWFGNISVPIDINRG